MRGRRDRGDGRERGERRESSKRGHGGELGRKRGKEEEKYWEREANEETMAGVGKGQQGAAVVQGVGDPARGGYAGAMA